MSDKILDLYNQGNYGKSIDNNKSLFSKLGQRIDDMQKNGMSTVLKNDKKENDKKIEDSFQKIVIKKYGSILEHNSIFGNITVNPTQSVLRLLDKINSKWDTINTKSILPIQYSNTPSKSFADKFHFDSVVDFMSNRYATGFNTNAYQNKTFYQFKNIPKLVDRYDENKILKYPSSKMRDNYDESKNINYSKSKINRFEFKPKYNTIDYKATNLFFNFYANGFNTNEIGFNSRFIASNGNEVGLIFGGSILQFTNKSSLIKSISFDKLKSDNVFKNMSPTLRSVDFFNNTYAMGFSSNSQFSTVNNISNTNDKLYSHYITSNKTQLGISKGGILTTFNNINTSNSIDFFFNKYQNGFILNSQLKNSNYIKSDGGELGYIPYKTTIDTSFSNIDITKPSDFFYNTQQNGFTLNNGVKTSQYKYKLNKNSTDMIEIGKSQSILNGMFVDSSNNILSSNTQYDFNSPNLKGVLSQYVIYMDSSKKLVNPSLKDFMEFGINKIFDKTKRNNTQYPLNYPKIDMQPSYQFNIPIYNNAEAKVPAKYRSTQSFLTDIASSALSGFASNVFISLINTIYLAVGGGKRRDVNFEAMADSPLLFHTVAGQIYDNMNTKSSISNTITKGLGSIVGKSAANSIMDKATKKLTGALAKAINKTLVGSILPAEKILMMTQIMMGTKYTKGSAYIVNPDTIKDHYNDMLKTEPDKKYPNLVNFNNPENQYRKFGGDAHDSSTITQFRFYSSSFENMNISRFDTQRAYPYTNDGGNYIDLVDAMELQTLTNYGLPYTLNRLNNPYSQNITDTDNSSDDKNTNELVITSVEDPYLDNDLIDFYFTDLTTRPNGVNPSYDSIIIPFRAYITNLGNSVSAQWNAIDYMGRPDKFYVYQGFDRKGNLSFNVIVNSIDELEPQWRKINYLFGRCYPVSYPNQISMRPPFMALKVGDIYDNTKILINSVNVNTDMKQSPWGIDKPYQLPYVISIDVDFIVIYDETPFASSKHFAQKSDWISPQLVTPKSLDDPKKLSFRQGQTWCDPFIPPSTDVTAEQNKTVGTPAGQQEATPKGGDSAIKSSLLYNKKSPFEPTDDPLSALRLFLSIPYGKSNSNANAKKSSGGGKKQKVKKDPKKDAEKKDINKSNIPSVAETQRDYMSTLLKANSEELNKPPKTVYEQMADFNHSDNTYIH